MFLSQKQYLGIVPFMATSPKGRFVVFSKYLHGGLEQGLEIGEKLLWKYDETLLKRLCHERDYTWIFCRCKIMIITITRTIIPSGAELIVKGCHSNRAISGILNKDFCISKYTWYKR